MPVIRITDSTWERLKKWAVPLEDSPDDVLNKILDTAEKITSHPTTNTTIKRRYMEGISKGKKLPQKEYRTPILTVLKRHGGSAPVDIILDEIERIIRNRLTDIDYQLIPSGGSIRWKNTAEWERFALVKEGIIEPSSRSPRGVWLLSDKGKQLVNTIS